MAEITLTTQKPEPPEADFAFYIDFKRGEGSASRVFLATHDFIRACESLDRELLSSIDSNIETVMVLEDIEAGSLKTWLRNSLRASDDKALKDLDWRPQVGKYLVRAKYVILRWIDDEDAPTDLLALCSNLQQLAAETDVRHLPDYAPVSPDVLIGAFEDFQKVKDDLVEGDAAAIITGDDRHDMNLKIRWDIDAIEELAIRETEVASAASMVFIVKKPDYLGESRWDLRHGKSSVSAKIEDVKWLAKFQGRNLDVRPGDALRCKARIEMAYGFDNELIAERYLIEEVLAIVENAYQHPLFDEDR